MNPTIRAAIERADVKNRWERGSIADMDVFTQVVSDGTERIMGEAKALAAVHAHVIGR